MKKIILSMILIPTLMVGYAQDIYKTAAGEISFFSETPMENIDAVNKKVKGLINTKNNEFAFITTIIGFKFEKPLMEEHFNENYMESEKYKTAMFKGKIIGTVDYSKDGEYAVEAKGTLNIHGVDQERTIEAKIVVANGKLTVTSKFKIKLEDHKVDIPKLVVKNIAEVVEVTVKMELEPKTK